ncbi:MAG: response regulator [Nannocystales bacterium]
MTISVLVVDDDADLRRGLRALLEVHGLEVLDAGTLREADALARLYEPALLVVDGVLPDGNGIEWISILRSEGMATEVIFMSNILAKGRWLGVLGKLGVRHRINKRETPLERIAEIVVQSMPLKGQHRIGDDP